MDCFVLVSGCSGGGKSTLINALAAAGYATVAEPGRRIVREEQASGGTALPWRDATAFCCRAIAMALADRAQAAALSGPVFFDRGLIDAVVALEHLTGEPALAPLRHAHRAYREVFFAPPWPDLFATDPERRHDFAAAVAEHDRLVIAYHGLGYTIVLLPRTSVASRVAFVLERLGLARPSTW